MGRIGRWGRMRYGKGESDIERGVGVLRVFVCAAEEAKRCLMYEG